MKKRCCRCGEEKPLDQFSIDNRKPHGRGSSCRECRRAYCRVWTKKPHVRASKRRYARTARDLAIEWQRKYYATHPDKVRESRARWCAANKHKRRAHSAVANALRQGRLKRGPCETCGAMPTEAHHDDYSRPLDVKWFCRLHHCEGNHAQYDADGQPKPPKKVKQVRKPKRVEQLPLFAGRGHENA